MKKRVAGALAIVSGVALLGFALGPKVYQRVALAIPNAASHKADTSRLTSISRPQASPLPEVAPREEATPQPPPPPAQPPQSAVLKVPYTVQAPFGNWRLFENACEEAAVLMAHDYLAGDTRAEIPAPEADAALRAMMGWREKNGPNDINLSLEQMGKFSQAYYGHKFQLAPATKENILAAVSAGNPVIIPATIDTLRNPNYLRGHIYHVVLIKGFQPGGLIANDAGVAQGKDWFYSWDVINGTMDSANGIIPQGRVMLTLAP